MIAKMRLQLFLPEECYTCFRIESVAVKAKFMIRGLSDFIVAEYLQGDLATTFGLGYLFDFGQHLLADTHTSVLFQYHNVMNIDERSAGKSEKASKQFANPAG